MALSIRNQIEATVTGILRGPVLSEVDVETTVGLMAAVVTTRAVDDLELRVGERVLLRIDAMAVAVDKP
ncbi:MAG: TOBE domain-containing protein [Deltaproteobacteria bacterium]|nr:TOBE domain-containing protein [Deltaproteobacteria bacterium]